MWAFLSVLAMINGKSCKIVELYRHAVKGLSSDKLTKVTFAEAGETFPDDRRFALLQKKNEDKFNSASPEWLHKENFLCSFSDPKLMSTFQTSYQILNADASMAEPCDTVGAENPTRLLTVNNRDSSENLLGPIDLSSEHGLASLAKFFSERSGKEVVCVSACKADKHKHQFGNTSSGVKARGDTRTMHIINANTVRDIESKIGIPLNPSRFRPNIVLDGLTAWEEFDLVGKEIKLGTTRMSIVSKTVRCEGVSVDPLDSENILDIPGLLTKHYPEYGPFLGVYAVLDKPGSIAIGDSLILQS